MTEPATPTIVTRDEWERDRGELLDREKAHTRAGDGRLRRSRYQEDIPPHFNVVAISSDKQRCQAHDRKL